MVDIALEPDIGGVDKMVPVLIGSTIREDIAEGPGGTEKVLHAAVGAAQEPVAFIEGEWSSALGAALFYLEVH
jgi:hypothetical protein